MKLNQILLIATMCALTGCGESSSEKDREFNEAESALNEFAHLCQSRSLDEPLNRLNVQIRRLGKLATDLKSQGLVRIFSNFATEIKQVEKTEDTTKRCVEVRTVVDKYKKIVEIHNLHSTTSPDVNVAYSSAELAEVNKVFETYGKLQLASSNVAKNNELDSKPWSSYWYPYSNSEALVGPTSALEKFDSLLKKLSRSPGAVSFEKEIFSGLNTDTWEGHCHAWAMASVLYKEPVVSLKMENIIFSSSDLKLLLLKASEGTKYQKFGIKYLGNSETDGTFQDLRPEAFHKIITTLIDNNQPLLIDDDPGVEVWTKPVFGYQLKISQNSEIKEALDVETWVGVVRQQHEYPSVKTRSKDMTWIKYVYRLYYTQDQSGYSIIAGQWVNESVDSHPDAVLVPLADQKTSYNPSIEANRDLIDHLVSWGTD